MYVNKVYHFNAREIEVLNTKVQRLVSFISENFSEDDREEMDSILVKATDGEFDKVMLEESDGRDVTETISCSSREIADLGEEVIETLTTVFDFLDLIAERADF